MTALSPATRARLLAALPAEAGERAVAELEATAFPLAEPGSELETRIRLAIVKLVCDPWRGVYTEPAPSKRFESALVLAKTDWRDLLAAAGLEHDDWRKVLLRAGYDPP